MNKMAVPTGQHGKYWQLLNRLSDFHTVFTDDLRKRCSLFPDQGDWCHSSPLSSRSILIGCWAAHDVREAQKLLPVVFFLDF